jgi:CRISPR-associated exonuclease Cas4
MAVTGTLINYYRHCKRQCWLHANRINLEDNSEDVRIGKILHELSQEKSKKSEIKIDNIVIDKITKEYLVEMKKSDADTKAVKWQILLYLKILKTKGIEKKGKIEYMQNSKTKNKIEYVLLSKELEDELDEVVKEIEKLIQEPQPPREVLIPACKKCAYYEYCFI